MSLPFDASLLPADFDLRAHRYLEIDQDSSAFSLVLRWIPQNPRAGGDGPRSFAYQVAESAKKGAAAPDYAASKRVGRVQMIAGRGFFEFADQDGEPLYALCSHLGQPVGTNCGARVFTSFFVFSASEERLAAFVAHLLEREEKTELNFYTCFSWDARRHYWRSTAKVRARPLESVVLPDATRDRLLRDLSQFLEPDTKAFYELHGIPYRRSYLFYGLPGTGKTSFIQALAGHYGRSVSYVQASDPDMDDESLRSAIRQIPDDTIVVFEDIDSLFGLDRANKVASSKLTFSGLLNALDGIGSSNGQLFVLTTNLREQLDSALIRNGRVDLHVEFTHMTDGQLRAMWDRFYPRAEPALGPAFVSRLRECLQGAKIAACSLQHFFVGQMRSTAEEALANVQCIVDDMREKAEETAKQEAEAEAEAGREREKKEAAAAAAADKDKKDSKDKDQANGAKEREQQEKKEADSEAGALTVVVAAAEHAAPAIVVSAASS